MRWRIRGLSLIFLWKALLHYRVAIAFLELSRPPEASLARGGRSPAWCRSSRCVCISEEACSCFGFIPGLQVMIWQVIDLRDPSSFSCGRPAGALARRPPRGLVLAASTASLIALLDQMAAQDSRHLKLLSRSGSCRTLMFASQCPAAEVPWKASRTLSFSFGSSFDYNYDYNCQLAFLVAELDPLRSLGLTSISRA